MKAYNKNGRVTCNRKYIGHIDITNGNEFTSASCIVDSIPRCRRPHDINTILRHVVDSMEAYDVRKFVVSMNLEVDVDQMIKHTPVGGSCRFLTLAGKAGLTFRKLEIFSKTYVFDFKKPEVK